MDVTQQRVEQMLDARGSFEEIETLIEHRAELPSEAKSGPCLLAWAEAGPREADRS